MREVGVRSEISVCGQRGDACRLQDGRTLPLNAPISTFWPGSRVCVSGPQLLKDCHTVQIDRESAATAVRTPSEVPCVGPCVGVALCQHH